MDKNLNLELDYPVLATKGIVLFPHNDVTLEVGRPFSKNALAYAQEHTSGYIFVITQKRIGDDIINLSSLNEVGTIAKIKSVRNYDNGIIKVVLSGLEKAKVSNVYMNQDMYFASFGLVEDISIPVEKEAAYIKLVSDALQGVIIPNKVPKALIDRLSRGIEANEFADLVAQNFVVDYRLQMSLLKQLDIGERFESILTFLRSKEKEAEIEKQINNKVQKKLDDNQREYILREKMRAIKEELGDVTPTDKDADGLLKQVENNPYPEYIKNKAKEEIKRLELMNTSSPEYSMQKNYIDWLLNIPWYQKTDDNNDIFAVEKVLNEDHYGLEKIKERILEYLAVKTVTNSLKAPIICFAGPPGVGKTSLAKSIARALNRKFVKMSLGGVTDESEIRGHRRTYLGSLPGRIIQQMKKAGVVNPVFLLDEIDKMGKDYKGDPTSALLELLDPEQNKDFSDNYIEEPYDLSSVLFICTANYLENIPAPLFDRLEIINVSSYTEIEKLNIAMRHLVAKQLIAHGIENEGITFTEEAILYIIRRYTREAGVRSLERAIANICRKLVIRKLKNDNKELDIKVIDEKYAKECLGNEEFDYQHKEENDQVGVVTGLAYTQYGGDILPIEVNYFNGKGNLILTGKLGDVMKESASIAFDYVKAKSTKYGIDPAIFDKIDIHIHVPEGAVPKDGPSAGITITTAIVSLLTNRKVKSSVAMTGEVTLRGNVLPIGGLKEKSISAHRSGIKTVIIPNDNLKDLDELPDVVKEEIKFIPISNVKEAIEIALYPEHVS